MVFREIPAISAMFSVFFDLVVGCTGAGCGLRFRPKDGRVIGIEEERRIFKT